MCIRDSRGLGFGVGRQQIAQARGQQGRIGRFVGHGGAGLSSNPVGRNTCPANCSGTGRSWVSLNVRRGYGDQEGYDRTTVAVRDAAHAHDANLRKDGVLMGIAGDPVQVRNLNAAHVETTNGPFMVSSLPLAGFAIIEAANLAEAIDMVSRTPCAVAHGLVEVWPLEQAS